MEPNNEIKVLLVDDEEGFRHTLGKRLAKRGFLVGQVSGGREAIDYLSWNSVHVVVLDMKMPGLDGLDTLRLIKNGANRLEVILLTGHASGQDGVAGIMAGAFDYMTKPVEVDHLAGKIRQAYERITWLQCQAKADAYRFKVEQRMDAAERLASLGTLAAGIAHEINNPLAIISESAGWLKSSVDKTKEIPDDLRARLGLALSKIEAGVERTRRITHQLLGFVHRDDWTREEFDPAELIEEVIALTRKAAVGVGAEITFSAPNGAFRIYSDPNQVRQVLINLVNNAVQAVDSDGRIEISLKRNGSHIKIRIEDNGTGIPKENLERIFEPFFSTKPPGQGTGLGLSVSRNIMVKLGGTIMVESRVGKGTVFTITLPDKNLEDEMKSTDGEYSGS